jgi:gliding motility-associated-like protein
MHKLYLSLLLFLIGEIATAQLPVLQWAKAFHASNMYNYTSYSNGRSIGVDQQGNVYAAGLFTNTVDFDPGPNVYTLAAGGYGERAIYISKLASDGNFVWAKQLPVLVEFGNIELKIDNEGNILLASDLRHPADMDPGPGVHMMKPIGAKDAFVIKLNSDGNLLWVKQFGGPGDTVPNANVLAADKDNNVIICGGFNATVDFDPGPDSYNLTSSAHIQSYIVKLSSKGDFIWAKQFGNSPVVHNNANITDIECDAQGNLLTIGNFGGTCDFDPGAPVYPLISISYRDGFVAKLDAAGNFVWAKKIGNIQNDPYRFVQPMGIDIDGMNNIVTAGYFTGTHDFDPGAGVQSRSSNNGTYDVFILKLNGQGDFSWVKFINSSESETGNDVAVDNEDNIYTIGSFGKSVDFDPGPGDFTINSPHYGAEALIKLSPEGNFIYAAPFQSINYGTALFRRMVVDHSKSIYITGYIAGVLDFDPGPEVFPFNGLNGQSPFVLKLNKCKNMTYATLHINTCNSYTLNNERFDSSGIYRRTIPNSLGCDSLITLRLTINKKFTRQTKAICEGESLFAGGTNQYRAGVYKDTLQTREGCDSIVTTHLTVHPNPTPDLGKDKDLCSNTQLSITPGTFASYLWQNASTSSSFTIQEPGTYWVKVTNSFQCTATDTLIVGSMLPAPAHFLKEKDSICKYGKVELIPASKYVDYHWSTGANASRISVQQPGTYWLTVTDENGCSGKDSIDIFSKQCITGIYFPNAFTPNHDGKNDVFRASVYENLKDFSLQVYNRWGELVFQTTDPSKGWDGRHKGVLQGNEAYVWLCRYQSENGASKTERGTVMVLR